MPRQGRRGAAEMPPPNDNGLRKAFSYDVLTTQPSSDGSSSPANDSRTGPRQGHRSASPQRSHFDDSSSVDEEEASSNVGREGGDDPFVDSSAQDETDTEEKTKEEQPAGSVDPQSIYAAESCVFVANLARDVSDSTLEAEVTKAFSVFGPVFVKIARNRDYMPHAYCQFTDEEHARRAIRDGYGIVITGRPCRTEQAIANSIFIVSRKNRQTITADEVRDFMTPHGAIASIVPLEESQRVELQLPSAFVVSYCYFDPGRDITKAARINKQYTITAKKPEKGTTPISGQRHGTNSQDSLAIYKSDRNSAHLGNLPHDITEDELRRLCSRYGQIVSLTLHKKTITPKTGATVTTFSFVEFTRPDSVDDLIRFMNNVEFRGRITRVSRKTSRAFDTTRQISGPASGAQQGYGRGSLARQMGHNAPRPGIPSYAVPPPRTPYGGGARVTASDGYTGSPSPRAYGSATRPAGRRGGFGQPSTHTHGLQQGNERSDNQSRNRSNTLTAGRGQVSSVSTRREITTEPHSDGEQPQTPRDSRANSVSSAVAPAQQNGFNTQIHTPMPPAMMPPLHPMGPPMPFMHPYLSPSGFPEVHQYMPFTPPASGMMYSHPFGGPFGGGFINPPMFPGVPMPEMAFPYPLPPLPAQANAQPSFEGRDSHSTTPTQESYDRGVVERREAERRDSEALSKAETEAGGKSAPMKTANGAKPNGAGL